MCKNFTCLYIKKINVIISYENLNSIIHTKPLVHKTLSTMPATNDAQFKLPSKYIYVKVFFIYHFDTFIFWNGNKFINKTFTFNNII
jgi:hypothetical protein